MAEPQNVASIVATALAGVRARIAWCSEGAVGGEELQILVDLERDLENWDSRWDRRCRSSRFGLTRRTWFESGGSDSAPAARGEPRRARDQPRQFGPRPARPFMTANVLPASECRPGGPTIRLTQPPPRVPVPFVRTPTRILEMPKASSRPFRTTSASSPSGTCGWFGMSGVDAGAVMRCARWRRRQKEWTRTLLKTAAEIEQDELRKKAAYWASQSQSSGRVRALLALAGTEPQYALSVAALDRDPFLLAVGNGTLDLRSGKLRPGDPGDLISATKIRDAGQQALDHLAAGDLQEACNVISVSHYR